MTSMFVLLLVPLLAFSGTCHRSSARQVKAVPVLLGGTDPIPDWPREDNAMVKVSRAFC